MVILIEMSTRQRDASRIINDWIRQVIIYNKDDLKDLFISFLVITSCSIVLTYAWAIGWEGGITWNVMYILSNMIPGPAGPIFISPLGFLFGLTSIFWFDSFKRLQGLLLLIPGFLGVVSVIFFFDRLNIAINLLTIITGIGSVIVGLLYGGVLDTVLSDKRMDVGFMRLIIAVGLIGILGIFEATFDYTSPLLLNLDDPIQMGSLAVPMEFAIVRTIETISFAGEPIWSIASFVFYLLFLFAMVTKLKDFTEYEMDKKILILGPDRAGKTWLMSGAGYCLREKAMGSDYGKPELNSSLRSYHNIFVKEDFDNDKLEANDPGEFEFFRFQYEHGVLPKRIINVTTVDYAGEHLESVNINEPWDDFNQIWGGKSYTDSQGNDHEIKPDELPDFELLEELEKADEIDETEIPSLLSVMIDKYDTIGLTLPADAFATEFNDAELPEHLDETDIQTRNTARKSEPINPSPLDDGYFSIYENLLAKHDNKDVFFIVTMADTFLETFRQENNGYVDPKGNPNWRGFREHVLDQIYDEHNRSEVSFLIEDQATDLENYYPIYFEPGEKPYYTNEGKFKPELNPQDPHDEFFPLRGLNMLLKRMGR